MSQGHRANDGIACQLFLGHGVFSVPPVRASSRVRDTVAEEEDFRRTMNIYRQLARRN